MKTSSKTPAKNLWATLVGAASVGMLSSFIQTIERIDWGSNPKAPLVCDINSVFSCNSVFGAWQSRVFGFPNSLMCIVFFAVLLGAGLAGLSGSILHRKLRLVLHFFSVFFLGFGAWYLLESAYVINALCIFCIFCYAAVIALNWAWLRINANDLPLATRYKKALIRSFSKGADTFFWILWTLTIAALLFFKFA